MGTTSDRLVAKRDTELTEQERTLVNSWGSEAFGPQQWVRTFSWSSPDWRLFLLEGGQPVTHVKITMRRARVGTDEVLFAGVGGVMTPRINQRRGYSSALLEIARGFIFSELHAQYGFLFCLSELRPFYGRLGWLPVNSPVHIEQSQGRILWPKAAMVLPARGRLWRDVEVDVCGEPW